jgi:hypothetical protein
LLPTRVPPAPAPPLQTLAEVLQQRVRLDDPHALRRKQFELRVKGEPAPLSETEILRARCAAEGWGGACPALLGRGWSNERKGSN